MIRTRVDLRQSLLWHLLNEGSCTSPTLVRLTGCGAMQVRRQLEQLEDRRLARRLDKPLAPPRAAKRCAGRLAFEYGLTPQGIEQALLVPVLLVHFAEQPTTTQPEETAS